MAEKLFGALSAEDEARLAAHLEACPACAEALREMEATLAVTAARTRPEPTPAFWDGYYDRLEARMATEAAGGTARYDRLAAWWQARLHALAVLLTSGGGYRLAGAVALLAVAILIGWLALRPAGPETPGVAEAPESAPLPAVPGQQEPVPHQQEAPQVTEVPEQPRREQQPVAQAPPSSETPATQGPPVRQAALAEQTDRYLERSKVLLVGLVNMEPDRAAVAPVLARRQEMARTLADEADTLRNALDDTGQERLGSLIDDLKVVLLQIANMDLKVDLQFGDDAAEQNVAALELVRSGVERQGLLLKINLTKMQ